MATKIVLPRVFQEISFATPAETMPSITIDLPSKLFAVHSYDSASSASRALQLYSHTQWGINDGSPASTKWDTIRWYAGMTSQDIANSVPSDPAFISMAEIIENRLNAGVSGDHVAFKNDCFAKIHERTGVSDPADTNIVDDYWNGDSIGNIGLVALLNLGNATYWNNWRTRFSSETEARKDRDGNVANFFTDNKYLHQNWLVGGYLDGWHRVPEYVHPYLLIAELEQKHLAIRRKTFQFNWDIMDGAEWKIYRFGSFQSIKFDQPSGRIFKSTLNGVPPEMMYRMGIINSTIGDAMIHWGAAGRTTNDISRWVRSYNGGFQEDKTKWQSIFDSFASTYNPNNPSHPTKSPGDNPNNYTGNNVQIIPPTFGGPTPHGIHDATAGRYMAHLTRADTSKLRWAPFTTKTNGGSEVDGYFDGDSPVLGTLGDGSFSTLNNRNFGQHNIVNQLQYKKDILLVKDDYIHYCRPFAKVTDEIEVTVDDGTVSVCEVKGPGWHTFAR